MMIKTCYFFSLLETNRGRSYTSLEVHNNIFDPLKLILNMFIDIQYLEFKELFYDSKIYT